ncbi:DNRLRE domain-containing protein [Metabacillus fastidiosus]|uniref:DNRLRE domain-containing protein n=1 Tax=Metabacillus fastidiosus TaxID=1458 RepID=UPI000824C9BC|nr:DNRLRE domain-containing protein [Metabacillus fastidiosus]
METSKKRSFYSIICRILVSTMIITSIPIHGVTKARAIDNSEESKQDEVETATNNESIDSSSVEVESLRNETTKVFVNKDGSYTAEAYTKPVHYKKDNKWHDIDNTLVENNTQELENKSNSFKVKFPKKPKKEDKSKLYTFSTKGHEVVVEFIDNTNTKPKVHNGLKDTVSKSNKNKVKYENLYDGVTFDYAVDSSKIKENIILDSYRGKNTFQFNLLTKGLKAAKKEDGTIEFTDSKTGEFLFYIQRPYMYDSSESKSISEKVTQEIIPTESGFTLTITADEAYLKDPNRVYPVVIDPWIDNFKTSDAFVASKQDYGFGLLDYLSVGSSANFGKTRTYLRWNPLPDIPDAEIVGGSVGIYQYETNADVPISLHRLTQSYSTSTINWTNQPSYNPVPEATISRKDIGYIYFPVNELLKDWYNKKASPFGVVLKYADNQEETAANKLFHATEWVNPNGTLVGEPKLVISYRPKELLGITDYWAYTPDLLQGEGTAVVNLINGNMVYDVPLTSLPSRTDAFNLKLVYNSRSSLSDTNGIGWTLSSQRKLIPSSDNSIIEYIDENGTQYHFSRNQYDSKTGYSSPEGTAFELTNTESGYTLKQPDETVLEFDSYGRNTKITDEKGDNILYSFDGTSFRVVKISERFGSDSTGRDLSLIYNPNGLLEKVTDFRGTDTIFSYSPGSGGNLLTGITYAANRSEKKSITFSYNTNGKLENVVNANGHKGTIEYDSNNRATKIIDPRSETFFSQLAYPSQTETIFTDANGNKTYYKNDSDQPKGTVNVIEMTEDYQGTTPSTTKYEWKNNEVTKVIEPNKDSGVANGATTTADYDEKGNLTNITTPNQETETTMYDEKSNVTNEKTNTGLSAQFEYDNKSNLLFSSNQLGLTNYFSYDRFGNVATNVSTTSLGFNLLTNSNFEALDSNSLPTNWLMKTGTGYATSNDHKYGKRSIKMTLTGTDGGRYLYQVVPMQATSDKNYTVSGWLKTDNVSGTGAQLRVYFKDASNQFIKDGAGNTIAYVTKGLKGTRDWMLVSNSFTAPSNAAFVEVELVFSGAGTAYFDGVQLNSGSMVADYVSNENASMEAGTGTTIDNWTLNAISAGDGRSSTVTKAGKYSARLTGSSTAKRYIGQTVETNGQMGDPVTISGWANAQSPNSTGEFALQVSFVYSDGTEGKYTVPFDKTLVNKWQFVKKTFRATKNFNQVKIYALYNNQAGTAYFDNIKLEEQGSTETRNYDANGNLILSNTDALNQTMDYKYDANGNQTEVTTPGGRKALYGYDFLDHLKNMTQVAPSGMANITTSYEHDVQGNLKARKDPRGNVTSFEYNAVNQVTKETDPLGKFIKSDYEANGNLKTVEIGKGTKILSNKELKYDRKNQLTEEWLNGQKKRDYTYDFAGNVKTIQQDGQTYSFTYDPLNRLLSSQEPAGYKLTYSYEQDLNKSYYGSLNSYVESFGSKSYTTTVGYDDLQRISSIKTPTGESSEYYYNEKSLLTHMKLFSDTNVSSLSIYQTFDDAGRLQGKHLVGATNLDQSYSYDLDGNIKTYNDGKDTHNYVYDFANRLQSWTYKGSKISYEYDESGNLKNPNGKSLTFNEANEVNGFTYDEAGNLLQDDKYLYEWDGEGQLLAIKDLNKTTIASFTYDPNGLRKTKTVGSTTYYYHYNGSELIRITDDNNQTIWAFTWSYGKPMSVTNKNGETFFFVTNQHGDVVQIVDKNGVSIATYSYDPWGNPTSSEPTDTRISGQPIRYAGYVYDGETKLYYLQSRYYDPQTARFISRDTYPGDVDNSGSQNAYVYAEDNPVMYTDNEGTWVVNAAFLIYDGIAYVKNPSLSGAAWLIVDVASFADPTGTASTIAHSGKLLKGAKVLGKTKNAGKAIKKAKSLKAKGKKPLKLDLQFFAKDLTKGISKKLLDGNRVKIEMFKNGKYDKFKLEKDRAINSGVGTHGGSAWKLKDTRKPGSYWTLDKNGKLLRYSN